MEKFERVRRIRSLGELRSTNEVYVRATCLLKGFKFSTGTIINQVVCPLLCDVFCFELDDPLTMVGSLILKPVAGPIDVRE